MEIVFITGASTGIGYASALLFARSGYNVIATLRNIDKNHSLYQIAKEENLKIDIKQLDITDEQSVQTVVSDVIKNYGKIDILINNAGSGFLGTLEQTSLSQAKEVMDVNFFGVWRVTQAIFPHMRKRKSGRIMTITSMGGIIGQPFNEAYCAAKFAVEGMMESLAPVAKRLGIQLALVEPGPVNTNFVSSVLQTSPELPAELKNDYQNMWDSYSTAAKNSFVHIGQSSDEIASILLSIARENNMNLRYQTSPDMQKLANMKLNDLSGNNTVALTGSRLN